MVKIVYDNGFDFFPNDKTSRVFQVFPSVFGDDRGYFSEVLKDFGVCAAGDFPIWFSNLRWIRQINRSCSKGGTVRGCHAQKGAFCQAKLVQAVTKTVYDIITDARPDSTTFGTTSAYVLDPEKQNFLFVPRGFLHAFAVPDGNDGAVFEYFCDNVYDKESEVGVNPRTLLPDFIKDLEKMPEFRNNPDYAGLFSLFRNPEQLVLSRKDEANRDYLDWIADVKNEYDVSGKVWYK